MVLASFTLKNDYWETTAIQEEDIEGLYHHLLEIETPLSVDDLVKVFIEQKLAREQEEAERKASEGGTPYLPKNLYEVGEKIVFSQQDWQTGEVTNIRDSRSYLENEFKVVEVTFEDGSKREYAAGLEDHKLNIPVQADENDPMLNLTAVYEEYGETLGDRLKQALDDNDDFVYIAGRWFPQALLVDVNVGNLNLAEALLDMAEGGPLHTSEILGQVELPEGDNKNLAEFSLDLAMQEDDRFDEVGSAGEVAWFLKRMEPEGVQKKPLYLRYQPIDYSPEDLSEEMLELEAQIDDELSPVRIEANHREKEQQVTLIFPHWRSGTLPLTSKVAHLLPTAYESPRVRFMLVDEETGKKFPGWVVRLEKYVYGLKEWYQEKGLMPGGKVFLKKGKQPGEVLINTQPHRSAKEWVRTALIGADGGVVYAMLKQPVSTSYDDWMMIAMPQDTIALDQAWQEREKKPRPFEQVVVDSLRELAKLNPQSHVHVAELYSAVNVVYRCPPGPIMSLLSSRPWFNHVGDLHYRYDDETAAI